MNLKEAIIIIILVVSLCIISFVQAMSPIEGRNNTISGINEYGDLRYVINYKNVNNDFWKIAESLKINFLHWHGPFQAYDGLPKDFENSFAYSKKIVNKAHEIGSKIIMYVAPVFAYGDPINRSYIFNTYDYYWDSYEKFLGKKMSDPITWAQKDEQGDIKRFSRKDREGFYICPNNVDLRNYLKGIIKIIVKTGADGVFFDGPFFKNGSCFCDSCNLKFRYSKRENKNRESEKSIPSGNLNSFDEKEKREFFSHSLADFLKDMTDFAKSINPNFIVTANYWTNDPSYTLKSTAQNLELWSPYIDFVFCESQYNSGPRTENNIKYSNTYLYKALKALGGGKMVALLKTAVQGETKTAEENLTKLCLAEALSNQSVWQLHDLTEASVTGAKQYFKFTEEHMSLFKGWESYADVAVITSPRQVDFKKETNENTVSKFLTDHHTPHNILTETMIKEEVLSKYKVIVLPRLYSMNSKNIAAIYSYIADGGSVLVFEPTSVTDEYGRATLDLESILTTNGRILYQTETSLVLNVKKGKAIFIKKFDKLELDKIITNNVWNFLYPQKLLKSISSGNELEFQIQLNRANEQYAAIHAVNYDVERNGRLNIKENISISLKLPFGKKCKNVHIFSADENTMGEIKWVYDDSDIQYVKVNIPIIKIYSIIVIELI